MAANECFEEVIDPSESKQVWHLLEEQAMFVREGCAGLAPEVLLNLKDEATAEWARSTGLTTSELLHAESPLFRLVNLKLIFQMFAGKVHELSGDEVQDDVFQKAQDSFFEQFQQICGENSG
jgi:hypothetical protein